MKTLAASPTCDLERPVFIIGVGRSGTSLLQSMLNAHPDLAFTPETHFFRRYVADEQKRRSFEQAGKRAFAATLSADEDFARAGISVDTVLADGTQLDLLESFRSLLRAGAEAAKKTRVGDKDPRNIDYLPALARDFPGALVLHVIRDPRDVLLSRTKAAWSAPRPWWSHPLIYREQLRRGRALGAQLFGARYLEVRYEALITDAEATLREVCEHIGLEWSVSMLEFSASAATLVAQRELPWKKETLGPLLADNTGKWREGLTTTQVRYTERVCSEAFDELGYQRSDDERSYLGVITPALRGAATLAYDWKLSRRSTTPNTERRPLAPVSAGLAPQLEGRLRVLHADGNSLYASSGLQLFASQGGAPFEPIATAPGGLVAKTIANTTLPARLLRSGFHALAPLPGSGLLAVARGALLHCAPGEREFRLAHRVTRGTRPLNICTTDAGNAYFGEYFGNSERSEVHIFGTRDGRSWQVAYTFPAGSIRHVHGVHWDPYRKGMWVLTGDEGDEAGLWWTADEFETLEPVLRGKQAARAVTVLPMKDGVVVPMDTPFEQNYVQHLDPSTGKLEKLAALPGSVFCATRTSTLFALSTVVEKSAVNTDQRPALFVSLDGYDWQPAARFERDLAWVGDRRGYLQYPTLLLPTGRSNAPDVFATGQSIAGAHGQLLRWSASELIETSLHRPALGATG